MVFYPNMHKYSGRLTYNTNNSGRAGQPVQVEICAQFLSGTFRVAIQDLTAESVHRLENRCFNFQSRDSPVDLLARAKWRSDWFDRFTGDIYLSYPAVTGVPRELRVTLIASWDPAFAVLEFRIGDTFYQFSRRPPRGVRDWARTCFPYCFDSPPVNRENAPGDLSNHEPASSSTNPPPDQDPVKDSPPPLGRERMIENLEKFAFGKVKNRIVLVLRKGTTD